MIYCFVLFQSYIFDMRSGTYLHKLQGQTDVVADVEFHPKYPQVTYPEKYNTHFSWILWNSLTIHFIVNKCLFHAMYMCMLTWNPWTLAPFKSMFGRNLWKCYAFENKWFNVNQRVSKKIWLVCMINIKHLFLYLNLITPLFVLNGTVNFYLL